MVVIGIDSMARVLYGKDVLRGGGGIGTCSAPWAPKAAFHQVDALDEPKAPEAPPTNEGEDNQSSAPAPSLGHGSESTIDP